MSVGADIGYTTAQIHAICQQSGTHTTLAGLTMSYAVFEGAHRTWQFLNTDSVSFHLDAFDLNQPQSQQALDDAILATFRPANPAPGCSW